MNNNTLTIFNNEMITFEQGEYIKEKMAEHHNIKYDSEISKEDVFDEGTNLIPLAYTTLGDNEEFEIQVHLDVDNMRITKEVTPYNIDTDTLAVHYEYNIFSNVDDLIEFVEGYIDFDEMINIKANYEDLEKYMTT